MSSLYIHEQGVLLRRSGRRLLICKGSQTLRAVRLRDLERVALFGSVELSPSAAIALLDAGIEIALLSRGGRLRGRIVPAEGRNVLLRHAQSRCADDMELRLRVARAILDAKIVNSRRAIQRHSRHHPDPRLAIALHALDTARERLRQQDALDPLLGVEGEAARTYFSAFGLMLRGDLTFAGRSRRPPRDPVNALLSFGYTLLTTEIGGALAAEALDPHFGLLHSLDYGRPSLALDILEEFRAPVIDRLVLSLVNRRALRPGHFEDRDTAGVLLNDEGRARFLELYHRTLEAPFADPGSETPVTYRDLFHRQAHRMRLTIETRGDYLPYVMPGSLPEPSLRLGTETPGDSGDSSLLPSGNPPADPRIPAVSAEPEVENDVALHPEDGTDDP